MKTQQVINSFSAGVLSPRVTLRSDIEKYKSGLQQGVNWIITPQGGLRLREGLQRFADSLSETPTIDSRIFQYHNGGDESDLIVDVTFGFTPYVRFRRDGVLLPDTPTHQFQYDNRENLYFTNRADNAVITEQTRPPYIIKQDYQGNITGKHIDFNQIPYVLYNDDKSPSRLETGTPSTWTMTFSTVSGTWRNADPYWIRYGPGAEDNEPMDTYWFDTVQDNIDTIIFTLRQNKYLAPSYVDIQVTSPDNLVFTITISGGADRYSMRAGYTYKEGSETSRNVSIVDNFNPLMTDKEPAWSYPFTLSHNSNYYKCLQPHYSTTANEPGVGAEWTTYWEDLGTDKPHYYDWQPGGGWALSTYFAPWDRGFPAIALFNQQRLLFMNSPDATTGIWGSRLGDYGDFILGPDDNDPFYFDIDTSDTPEIRWAQAQRKLVLGTSSGDYAVDAEVTLSPSDIQVEKQNNARSHGTNAITINTDIFYIEQGREKVRSTGYSDDIKAQSSQDISLIAEHLLQQRINRLTLLQTPQIMMAGYRDDGSIVAFTFSQELNVGAWFEFETSARVIDICAGYSVEDDEDALWALVTYNETDRYIEKMPYPKRVIKAYKEQSDDTLLDQGIVCLDGWTQGTIVDGDNNVIQGLEEYNGLTVTCLVDDAYAGEYVVNDGNIILDTEDASENYVGQWVIGHAYTATAKTFEIAGGNRGGTAFGTKRRWNEIYVRLLDSALPVVNGQLSPDRTPETLMDIAETVREGLQDTRYVNTGQDDGSITIVQNRPYPTHVLGIYGQFTSKTS